MEESKGRGFVPERGAGGLTAMKKGHAILLKFLNFPAIIFIRGCARDRESGNEIMEL